MSRLPTVTNSFIFTPFTVKKETIKKLKNSWRRDTETKSKQPKERHRNRSQTAGGETLMQNPNSWRRDTDAESKQLEERH